MLVQNLTRKVKGVGGGVEIARTSMNLDLVETEDRSIVDVDGFARL